MKLKLTLKSLTIEFKDDFIALCPYVSNSSMILVVLSDEKVPFSFHIDEFQYAEWEGAVLPV